MENRQEVIKLVTSAIKEMKKNQWALLFRADLFKEVESTKFKYIYYQLKAVKEYLEEGDDVDEVLHYLKNHVFETQRSLLYDLFETKRFPALMELYENE
jgi:hypothetical protein